MMIMLQELNSRRQINSIFVATHSYLIVSAGLGRAPKSGST